jgi:hypothetical protein
MMRKYHVQFGGGFRASPTTQDGDVSAFIEHKLDNYLI